MANKVKDIQFWEEIATEKDIIINIIKSKFIEFLEQRNYRKYVMKKSFKLVKIEKNSIVSEVETHSIREEVKNHLKATNNRLVFDEFLKGDYLSKKYIESISSIDIDFEYGSENTAVYFFQNGVLNVVPDNMFLIDYEDYEGYVWKNQILQRQFEKVDFQNAEFKQFCWNIAGQKEDRLLPLETLIGYSLHSYKDPALTKAIILIDEEIDVENDRSEGGTGKSLIASAIGKLTPSLRKNGKLLKGNDKFFFADVEPEHKLIVFDDVKIDFSFESLYSMITGDMPLEKKYQNPTIMDFKDVPKVMITSNYIVSGTGGSSEKRRKVIFEVSPYYKNNPPLEEFGHRLFDDWDNAEWLNFYNYMMYCVQQFLNFGLVEAESINENNNRLIQETSKDFVEFLDVVLANPLRYKGDIRGNDVKFNKATLFKKFQEENEDAFIHINTFKKWLVSYAENKNILSEHKKSNSKAYVYFFGVLNQD